MKSFSKIIKTAIVVSLVGAMVLTGCSNKDNSGDADSSIGTAIDSGAGSSGNSNASDGSNSGNFDDEDNSSNSGDTTDNGNSSGENISSTDDDNTTVQQYGAELGEYASVNAQYFVKIGDRVYFRGYGENSFLNPCMWGDYLNNVNGAASSMFYYDEVTGDTVEAFEDNGFGKIVFDNGLFYLNGYKADGVSSYVYAVTPDGKKAASGRQYDGTIVDYQQNNIIIENNNGSSNSIVAYKASTNTEEISISSSKYIEYLGCYGDGVVYCEYTGSDSVDFYSRAFGAANSIWIGSVNKKQSKAICGYEAEYINVAWMYEQPSKEIFIGVEFRSGTAGVFDAGLVLWAIPWDEGSADVHKTVSGADCGNLPYVYTDESIYVYYFSDYEPYTYITVQNTNSNYDLFYQLISGDREYVIADFADPESDASEYSKLLYAEATTAERNEVFAMRVYQVYDEDGAVGWRDGYRANRIDYVRINAVTGKAETILTLNYKKNNYGG